MLENYKILELFTLENTSKIIESNNYHCLCVLIDLEDTFLRLWGGDREQAFRSYLLCTLSFKNFKCKTII